MTADLYEVLGVSRTATDDEIKKAFRRRARELHPDVNTAEDAEDQFKELNEAYDVLSDVNKRAQYDRFGTVGGQAGYGSSGFVDFSDIFQGGVGDFFSSIFGGSNPDSPYTREGRDMGVGLRLTLEEVASGVRKEIVYDRFATCPECDGSGLSEGATEEVCSDCHGQGRVVTIHRTFLGEMQTTQTCPQCNGSGKTISNPCSECEGQGRVFDRQKVSVEVPVGIRDGQQLRVAGFGEAGFRGAASGDLIVTCRIQPHDFFECDGDDLHCSLVVPMVQAALGAELHIDGLLEDERISVKIPEGCQHGDMVKVKGAGMPRFKHDDRGDLYVHVQVEIPHKLSKKERDILENLSREMGLEVEQKHCSPLTKLREKFN